MTRYYFHIRHAQAAIDDPDGEACEDLHAARSAALCGIRSILADDLNRGYLDLRGHIEIVDEVSHPVMIVPFRDAFEITC